MHAGGHGHLARDDDKRVTFGNVAKQFAIGGFTVMIVSYLSSHVSTKLAALLYSLPITYIPLLLYVRGHAAEQECPRLLVTYTGQTVASMLLFFLFTISAYVLVKILDTQKRGSPGTTISGAGLLLCILASLLFMAVPGVFYYYWVCSGACAGGTFTPETEPCYFG